MRNFSIKLIGKKPEKIEGKNNLFFRGEIRINDLRSGDFREIFFMNLGLWSVSDYTKQWKEAEQRLKNHDETCFVVNMGVKRKYPFVELWVLYKEKNIIFVNNRWLFVDEDDNSEYFSKLKKKFDTIPFNSQTCYQYIEPREICNQEGSEISTWSFKYEQ